MRLVMMNGGLGNQLFQYIFMRYIEEKSGEACVIEDLYFCGDETVHNGYEIERIFGLKHTRLSDLLDADVIAEMRRILSTNGPDGKPESILTVFKSCGIDLFPVQEGNFYRDVASYSGSIFSTPANEFYPDILRCEGDLYYYGYWINAGWMAGIIGTILNELTFPPLPDARNQAFVSQIESAGANSVAVHVRRGDFANLGWLLPTDYYVRSVAGVREQVEKPMFFFFSDDIPWVKKHLPDLGILPTDEVVFVEGNMGGNNYIDMQLMSKCRGMVIANSSFSYLAALLNTRPDKMVWKPGEKRQILYYKERT